MSNEVYKIGQSGRVKAAGVPMDLLFEPGKVFVRDVSPVAASEMAKQFNDLRQRPPDELRDRIFPRSRATKDLFRRGALLTRSTLKTDQGAGQFLSFEFGTGNGFLRYDIAEQMGYCIAEPFFTDQLEAIGNSESVDRELSSVRGYFQKGNLHEAQFAYERMQSAAATLGIITEREASVGRDALFFIHPSLAQEAIRIPIQTRETVRQLIQGQAQQFYDIAQDARKRFFAKREKLPENSRYNPPLYFQADIQLMSDGSAVIDQVQLPDVGLFLTTLDASGNSALERVQQATLPLAYQVIDVIERTVQRSGNSHLHVITRDEVLDNNEDVLELKEIEALSQMLEERGITVSPITVAQATMLDRRELALIFNVDTGTPAFTSFLERYASGDGPEVFPDPFLKLGLSEMTGYKRISLSPEHIDGLRAIVGGVELKRANDGIFRATLALDAYLRKLGITEDVFHLHLSSQKTPVACYRYDIRGIQIALGYILEGDSIVARNVPISPDRAVLFRSRRPIYSVFRFMATLEDV